MTYGACGVFYVDERKTYPLLPMTKYPGCDNDNIVMIACSVLTQSYVVSCCDCLSNALQPSSINRLTLRGFDHDPTHTTKTAQP